MAKNTIDLVVEAAKNIKTIQMDELLSKKKNFKKRIQTKFFDLIQLNKTQEIKAAWDKFDLDGNGVVEIKEVDMFLRSLNKKIPDDERKKVINLLDRNHNGKVEFVEMVRVYKQGVLTAYNL